MLRFWSEALGGIVGGWTRGLPYVVVGRSLWALELALIGAVAEMVMVLPMAVYFHRATMFAVPTNMLSVPLVAVLAPIAVVTFCASLLGPWVAMLPGATTALLLHGVTGIIGRVSAARAARPAGTGAGLVGGAVGGSSLGLLLLGSTKVARVGVACGNRIAARRSDGVMAGESSN